MPPAPWSERGPYARAPHRHQRGKDCDVDILDGTINHRDRNQGRIKTTNDTDAWPERREKLLATLEVR